MKNKLRRYNIDGFISISFSILLENGTQRIVCAWATSFLVILSTFVSNGCQNFPKFDSSGKCLFAKKENQNDANPQKASSVQNGTQRSTSSATQGIQAERIPDSKESEIIRSSENQNADLNPWIAPPTGGTSSSSPNNPVYWNSRRPNGGVLFPASLAVQGPLLVLEPKTTIAQIGEEIVLVGSYVGEGNEYLKTKEKIIWGLDGVGVFLTGNPSNCLLSCAANTNKNDEHYRTTETSNRLWRIHRGTSTTTDDISVLKGQTWTTVLSNQEGTSSVSILSENIDDWNKRTASATIHWVDALLSFPKSQIAPLGQPQILTTTVRRKSEPSQGRPNWIVRYEIQSGPDAGFGPNLSTVEEVATDSNGQASIALNQKAPVIGTNRILVQVYEPEPARVLIDQKTISQSWSGSTFFNIRVQGPAQIKVGKQVPFSIYLTNLTSLPQNGTVQITVPDGTRFIAETSSPAPLLEGKNVSWTLENIPAKSTAEIRFELAVDTVGTLNFAPRIVQTGSIGGETVIPTTPGNQPPTSAPLPPAPNQNPVDPATTVPALTEPTPKVSLPVGEKLRFKLLNGLPQQAKQNEKFSVSFQLENPNNETVSDLLFRGILPDGGIYYSNQKAIMDQSFETIRKPLNQWTAEPLILSFASSKVGLQTFILKAVDQENNDVATLTIRVNILPDSNGDVAPGPANAPQSPPASPVAAKPNVSIATTSDSPTAPKFEKGQTVQFRFAIKNGDATPLTNSVFVLTPEKSRSSVPWKFVSSNPTGAVATSQTEQSFQLTVPSIPANGQAELVFSLLAQNDISSGILYAELLSEDMKQSLAQSDIVYSIASVRTSMRPSASPPVEENAATKTEPKENGGSDSATKNESETKPSENRSKTESEKLILDTESFRVTPKLTDGKPDAIVNHSKNGESNDAQATSEIEIDRPFAYRMDWTNLENVPIEPGRLSVSINLSEELIFADEQPENSVLGKPVLQKNVLTFSPKKPVPPNQPLELTIELIPKKTGTATVNIEFIEDNQPFCLVQHSLEVLVQR